MARETSRRDRRPARSPEEREMQLAEAAFDLAEEQILAGTASSQVITAAMRFGSTREAVEQERIRGEIELQAARVEGIKAQENMHQMFADAMNAFRGYSGLPSPPPELES